MFSFLKISICQPVSPSLALKMNNDKSACIPEGFEGEVEEGPLILTLGLESAFAKHFFLWFSGVRWGRRSQLLELECPSVKFLEWGRCCYENGQISKRFCQARRMSPEVTPELGTDWGGQGARESQKHGSTVEGKVGVLP